MRICDVCHKPLPKNHTANQRHHQPKCAAIADKRHRQQWRKGNKKAIAESRLKAKKDKHDMGLIQPYSVRLDRDWHERRWELAGQA